MITLARDHWSIIDFFLMGLYYHVYRILFLCAYIGSIVGVQIQIWECSYKSPHQQWYFATDGTQNIRLVVRHEIS